MHSYGGLLLTAAVGGALAEATHHYRCGRVQNTNVFPPCFANQHRAVFRPPDTKLQPMMLARSPPSSSRCFSLGGGGGGVVRALLVLSASESPSRCLEDTRSGGALALWSLRGAAAAAINNRRANCTPLLSMSDDDVSTPEPPGKAIESAAVSRGGGDTVSPLPSKDAASEDASVTSKVETEIRGGAFGVHKQNDRILLDKVEDALGHLGTRLQGVAVPTFHVVRLGFGLSLLFYGMAFRTFAFHVIVFRIAGLRQVQRAVSQLSTKYRKARQSIREAAKAAETLGDRVAHGDSLKVARERMIEEKKRLLADGKLTHEETSYFMKKYNKELQKIVEEQQQFKSARSSIFSVRKSVDPKGARASVGGIYNALVASFTASTIQKAGQITLGLHVGSLLKTHILDLFGPLLDPIGYRLDLNTCYDKEDIPYMGKANAMGGPANLVMNILCYSVVFIIFRVHPSMALKTSMVYYGARVVTDYIIVGTEPFRRLFGQMTIIHTPWSAVMHAILTVLGYYYHRGSLYTEGLQGFHPLVVGPGVIGLVEPLVRMTVRVSNLLHRIDFFTVRFVQDPVDVLKDIALLAQK